ncbi:MAG: hypothetical protein IJ598_10205 [Ruminococcus sp.]|nr:hypothetical protein [Ruminococcus sp.]
MPRAKKAAATAETKTKKTVTAAEVKAEAAVEEKKPAAKKAAPKKTAPKKPAVAETPVVAEKPAETKVNFFVEFGGVQVAVDEVVKNIKATIGKEPKELAVYLKPEESKAYFVADGVDGAMDVFFC